MKKIIELAEKMLNSEVLAVLTGSKEFSKQYRDTTIQLNEAIKARRQLEQTPITEEWLKEHGFVSNSTLYKWEIWSKDNGTFFSVTKAYGKWYITDTCIEVSFLADLYDALELCDIKID